MHIHDICCIGHLTLDKIVNPRETVYMSGGASFYFSHAVSNLDVDYILVAGLAESEIQAVEDLRAEKIIVKTVFSPQSHYFENIYSEDQNERSQRVLATAQPFTFDAMDGIYAKYYHVGALLGDDFSVDFVKQLSERGKISIDCQGYLREVRGTQVFPVDWVDKLQVLKYVDVLKANEMEMHVLTGTKDVYKAAKMLNDWGVKEVLLTLGSMGSVIYDGTTFTMIPAYKATEVIDATGCGDTYMAGYLSKRSKGASMEESAKFAAAMATIKIESFGPFRGYEEDVVEAMNIRKQTIPRDEILKNLELL